eukprot:TRINITY_DN2990_c0_g1_i1.p1 TRINITY_DN2990_c0_g1~~TRINITY_DN2990_c0_g1_i1.p1  ORF type:complete len:467 (+),score=106.43 TRINITY_DN2990_c0_g1_i1:72-1472(+)
MTQNGSITCLFNGEEIGTELFARVEESGTLVVTSEIDDKVKEYLNTDIRFSNMERHGNNVKISLTSSSSVKGDAIILRSTCEEILNTLSEQLAIFCFQRDFSKKYKFVQTLHRPPKGPSVCVFEKNGVAYVGKVFEKADILKGYNIMSRAMGEIRALQRFSHKNVLTLHEIYSDEKNIVIVTEYMSAGTLYTLISKRITVPEREVALIAKQILDGLVHIHSKGYIHRDIKLENIFIRATKDKEVVPEVIVGDLDLCAEEKQKKWVICGTPGYLPPETFGENCIFTPKADIYSTGVVLAMLLTGTAPFGVESAASIMENNKHSRAVVPFLTRFLALPAVVQEVISGMIHPDPEQRWSIEKILSSTWMRSHLQEDLVDTSPNTPAKGVSSFFSDESIPRAKNGSKERIEQVSEDDLDLSIPEEIEALEGMTIEASFDSGCDLSEKFERLRKLEGDHSKKSLAHLQRYL